MATYYVGPSGSTGPISLSSMRRSIEAGANYNYGTRFTAETSSMRALTINASNYSALVSTVGWNTATPYQFSEMYQQTWSTGASVTNTFSANKYDNTGYSSPTTVTSFDSETDPGSRFNLTTGTYTAPAAGTYSFTATFSVNHTSTIARTITATIRKNSSTTLSTNTTNTSALPSGDSTTEEVTTNTGNITLAVNDTITLTLEETLGAAFTDADITFAATVAPTT